MSHFTALRDARIDAECKTIVSRFADALNRRDLSALEPLLAPELYWELPKGVSVRTPAAVCRGLTELWSHHERDDLWFDIDIRKTCSVEVVSEHLARGSIWMVMYSGVEAKERRLGVSKYAAELLWRCRQLYVLTDGGWRIAEHRIVPMYHSATFSLPSLHHTEHAELA
jgi:hypothetical protein